MASSTDIIVLISSDGHRINLPLAAVKFSTVIEEKVGKEKKPRSEVALDKVRGDILQNIVNFLNGQTIEDKEARKKFNGEFLVAEYHHTLDQLLDIALAACILGIQELEDLTSERIAHEIKNKSVEFVRDAFGIVDDPTAELVADTKAKYPWAFEGVDVDEEGSAPGSASQPSGAEEPAKNTKIDREFGVLGLV